MQEPGKYISEPKDTEDFKLYKRSIENLRESLSRTYKVNSYFIVQSRKGPRLFEFLFDEQEKKECNVVTEHALPFLFNKISKEPEKEYNFYVIDDAIYFGTTIENLVAEINGYIKLYNVKTKKLEVFTIIKSHEAKKLEGITINANTEIRKGYSHYFVNLLMSDLMSLGNTMEVEFPIISYRFDNPINEKNLYSQFYNLFNESASVYKIPEYSSSSFSGDAVSRFSILFNENNALFSKIRFYVKGNELRLAIMMPYNLVDSSAALAHLFDEVDVVKELWKSITDVINDNSLKVPYEGSIVRSRKRTLVVLANYLLSLKLYYCEREKIERALRKYAGNNDCRPVLDLTGLKYLVGDDELVEKVSGVFGDYLKRPLQYLSKMYPLRSNPSSSQVFEVVGYPDDEEKQRLQDFNSRMVINSHNAFEALSALFFNQTVLVEQWYRSFDHTSNYRLKFGFNFQGLYKTLVSEKRVGDSALIGDDNTAIHAWIDNRVDRGCVVPQYIINPRKNHWDRVFRPGENEEALTSTLARFAAFVLQSVKRVFDERYVPEFVFKKLLSIVYANVSVNLSDVMQLYLKPTIDGLYFVDVFDQGRNKLSRDVVDYLKDMFVLTVDGSRIDISKRFYNTEQVSNTTFSTFIDDKIVRVLSDVHEEMVRESIPLYRSYAICNKRLVRFFNMNEIREALRNCSIQVIGAVNDLKAEKDNLDSVRHQLIKSNQYLRKYILPDDYVESDSGSYIDRLQSCFLQIDFYINILSLVYFAHDKKNIFPYLKFLKERFEAIKLSNDYVGLIDRIENEYKTKESEAKYKLSTDVLKVMCDELQKIRDEK